MLRRLRRAQPPELTSINYTPEHVALAKTIARRRRIVAAIARSISLIR
jgi:glycosylphosphatidylinositol transamidase